MKIVAVFSDDPNQRALAAKLLRRVPLAHICVVRAITRPRRKLFQSAVSVTIGRQLRNAWLAMNRFYSDVEWPDVPRSTFGSSNDPALIGLVESLEPELVIVSGGSLLKKATLERFPPTMNLHTGISPYIRGGPNCTNWALALGEFDLIGNTVMWIDPGIDSGAIIATERTPLTGREGLTQLHISVMEHAHDLYGRAIEAVASGGKIAGVPQHRLAAGRLFYNRDWNASAIVRAAFNHRFRYRPFRLREEVELVDLGTSTDGAQ